MNIDKYLNWEEIWNEEIDLRDSIEFLAEDISKNIEIINVVNQFLEDKEVSLMIEECQCSLESDNCLDAELRFHFFFGESGGENESDTQGWSRDYFFTFDKDFSLIGAVYSQG